MILRQARHGMGLCELSVACHGCRPLAARTPPRRRRLAMVYLAEDLKPDRKVTLNALKAYLEGKRR